MRLRALSLDPGEGRLPGHESQAGELGHGVLRALRRWEGLIEDMEGWPGQGSCMVYEFLDDLTCRDALEDCCETLHGAARTRVVSRLSRLDDRYRAVTYDDGGAELAQYWRSLAEGRETRWWWTRRPNHLPPGW